MPPRLFNKTADANKRPFEEIKSSDQAKKLKLSDSHSDQSHSSSSSSTERKVIKNPSSSEVTLVKETKKLNAALYNSLVKITAWIIATVKNLKLAFPPSLITPSSEILSENTPSWSISSYFQEAILHLNYIINKQQDMNNPSYPPLLGDATVMGKDPLGIVTKYLLGENYLVGESLAHVMATYPTFYATLAMEYIGQEITIAKKAIESYAASYYALHKTQWVTTDLLMPLMREATTTLLRSCERPEWSAISEEKKEWKPLIELVDRGVPTITFARDKALAVDLNNDDSNYSPEAALRETVFCLWDSVMKAATEEKEVSSSSQETFYPHLKSICPPKNGRPLEGSAVLRQDLENMGCKPGTIGLMFAWNSSNNCISIFTTNIMEPFAEKFRWAVDRHTALGLMKRYSYNPAPGRGTWCNYEAPKSSLVNKFFKPLSQQNLDIEESVKKLEL
jgi:hypothetical protein